MIKKVLMSIFISSGMIGNAVANDDLVGGTFECEFYTYSFFPDNKYTDGFGHTVDYSFDGKQLKLRYIGYQGHGEIIEQIFKATYIEKKGKLILTRNGRQETCMER